MTLSATYDEISRLLREKSGQQIGFRYKDTDTLTVSFEASIPIPLLNRPLTHTVSADVRLAELAFPRVTLQLDAGGAGNMALDMASGMLLKRLPEGLVEDFSGGQAVLNLGALEPVKALSEKLQINRLLFREEGMCLDADIK